jgi:hypothetical protein
VREKYYLFAKNIVEVVLKKITIFLSAEGKQRKKSPTKQSLTIGERDC